MARRNTRQEAEELKAKFEADDPDAVIIIEEETGEAAQSPYGLGTTYQKEDIIGYDGEFPIIRWTVFFILEITTCQGCGKEVKSSAIGEALVCRECKTPSPKTPINRKPAYGDYEGTGWMDE